MLRNSRLHLCPCSQHIPKIILVRESQHKCSWILILSTGIVMPMMRVLSRGWFSNTIARLVVISANVGIPGDVTRGLVPTCLCTESIERQPRVRCAILLSDHPTSKAEMSVGNQPLHNYGVNSSWLLHDQSCLTDQICPRHCKVRPWWEPVCGPSCCCQWQLQIVSIHQGISHGKLMPNQHWDHTYVDWQFAGSSDLENEAVAWY